MMKTAQLKECTDDYQENESTDYASPTQSPDNSVIIDIMNDAQSCEVEAFQPATTGSATILGSAANSESAFDNSYTPHLLDELKSNPTLSLDEVLSLTSDDVLSVGGSQPKHHMTIVQYGQNANNSTKCRESERKAVLIGNQNYQHNDKWSNLATPVAEATALAGELQQRGYETTILQDLNSSEMDRAWGAMINGATEGDDLVAFYGGHGENAGLGGVEDSWSNNDIYTNGQVANAASTATGKGAHLRFIMDSCNSGNAVEAVREERLNTLAEKADSIGDHLYLAAAETCATIKSELIAHVTTRSDALLQNRWAIDAATTDTERDALRRSRVRIRQAYNQRATRIWEMYKVTLNALATALRIATGISVDDPPEVIAHQPTLGAQVDYCDMLTNIAMTPMEREAAEGGL